MALDGRKKKRNLFLIGIQQMSLTSIIIIIFCSWKYWIQYWNRADRQLVFMSQGQCVYTVSGELWKENSISFFNVRKSNSFEEQPAVGRKYLCSQRQTSYFERTHTLQRR